MICICEMKHSDQSSTWNLEKVNPKPTRAASPQTCNTNTTLLQRNEIYSELSHRIGS